MTDQIIQYIVLAGTCIASIAGVVGTCVGTIKKIKDTFKKSENEASRQNAEISRQLTTVLRENAELKEMLIMEKNIRLGIQEAEKNEKSNKKKLHR